jgi:hypothetical protein
MNELENFMKRHNISEKDMYLLSKLESVKKIETSINRPKLVLKQESILKNYSLTEPEKLKLYEILENSIFHQIRENVIKFRDFENEITLINESNKTDKKKIFVFISVFFGVLILFNLIGNKKSSNSINSQEYDNSQNCNQSSHELKVKENFINSGKEVYGISLLGTVGNCGYNFIVNGFDRSRGIGFVCYVKTNGENGVKIISNDCEYKFY